MEQVQTGMRLKSTVSTVEVIALRPGRDVRVDDLACAGAPMVPIDAPVPADLVVPANADTVELPVGKRYALGDLELLVTHGGLGPLTVAGQPLQLKQPNQLPSSD